MVIYFKKELSASLLFADDVVLFCDLQHALGWFAVKYEAARECSGATSQGV